MGTEEILALDFAEESFTTQCRLACCLIQQTAANCARMREMLEGELYRELSREKDHPPLTGIVGG
jgi:hypothetical protein